MYTLVWVTPSGAGIEICPDGAAASMGPKHALYTLAWLILTRAGIDICLDGNGWTVSACMGSERAAASTGPERALYTLVWLDGNG